MAHGAAPGSCGDFRGGLTDSGDGRSIAATGLPAHVVELLGREGVHSLEDWRRLGRKRLAIFGIPTRLARQLDEAARRART